MPSTKIKSPNFDGVESEKRDRADTFDFNERVAYNDFVQVNQRTLSNELGAVEVQSLPDEIIFPEELNRFLRDQIRELTAENGILRRSLEECESKIENLLEKNSQTCIQPAVGRASELAASKIVELSKKCREQTAEIEVLKSKCKILDSKLSEINDKSEETNCKTSSSNSDDGPNIRPFTVEEELKSREEENKILQEKINQINMKLYESKNTCTSLRQELNKAQKLLSREVGDNVTIASLSSKQSAWRGRAEQIQQLHNKLMEYEGNGSKISSVSTISDKRNIENLRKIEKERRQKAENSAKELLQITSALEASKRKQDAAKARIKVLENDLNCAKQSVALLNEKRSHDEQLIQALNDQLRSVEEKYRDRENEMLNVKERAENECMRMTNELNRLKSINKTYLRMIEERETEIDSLKNNVAAVSPEESSGFNKTRRKIHSPLLSRPGNTTLHSLNSAVSCTSRSNGDYNEYVTLGIAAEAERERLLELVIVLNRRLDEERFATDKIGETLRIERNKLARLETKLQRLEMERVGMSKVNTGYNKPRSLKSSSLSISGAEGDVSKDETRFRLELLEEECLALKTRLAAVQRDKASDLVMYKQMLDQARKTFQDAYRHELNIAEENQVPVPTQRLQFDLTIDQSMK